MVPANGGSCRFRQKYQLSLSTIPASRLIKHAHQPAPPGPPGIAINEGSIVQSPLNCSRIAIKADARKSNPIVKETPIITGYPQAKDNW